jgi:HTH-type transcriptional regulator/antitoxin HigA
MAAQPETITMTRQGRGSVADLVIETESDNARALATVKNLMSRRDRTPEEDALLKVLTVEISNFESKTYARTATTPAELIRFLLEQNGLSAKDLAGILGGKSHVSEILAGKRAVGTKQAVRLGKRFGIDPVAFVVLR